MQGMSDRCKLLNVHALGSRVTAPRFHNVCLRDALETAKAPRGNPRPCLWERAPDAYEPEHGAQPPQGLIVRLVPGDVNDNRPRLNRLSEMRLSEIRGAVFTRVWA
jgi:hypothetical protein